MLPLSAKALVLKRSPSSDSDKQTIYHDVVLEDKALAVSLEPDDILIKVSAVAFNHRDLWIRRGMYPLIKFGAIMGSDAAGTVVASGKGDDVLIGKRVFVLPMRGWNDHPEAPEEPFAVTGGVSFPPDSGVFSEYVQVNREQVIEAPKHLSDVEVAAWPLAGVTAWRVVSVNANVQKGETVLITGIGGGVALVALQLCLAKGACVYVTSGNAEKIEKAVKLGAKGGVNYKSENWPKELGSMLHEEGALLSAVIDSGGGDLFRKVGSLLKPGGKLVCYGMTAEPKITFTMREVMKNQKLIGSTMGSRKDLQDATNFIDEHKVRPVVSTVLDGLQAFDEGFEMLKSGNQFGKVVMKVSECNSDTQSKL